MLKEGMMGRREKNLPSLLMQQTETRVANVLSALPRLQISFMPTTLPCSLSSYSFESRLLELNPWLHAPGRFKSDYQIRRLWDKSS